MADENLRQLASTGWGSQVVVIYETFFLRDMLGYVFPGAVLLLGLERLRSGKFPEPGLADWLTLAFWLAAAYAAGVLLRLIGTWTHILVIAAVVGWLGDPWDLKAESQSGCRSLCERVWKSPHEAAVVTLYKSMYVHRSDDFDRVRNRESVFLHLAGTLGLAVLMLGLVSFVAMVVPHVGLDAIQPLSPLVSLLLSLAGIVLVAGHYRHARGIRLLHRAAEEAHRGNGPANKRVNPPAGGAPQK